MPCPLIKEETGEEHRLVCKNKIFTPAAGGFERKGSSSTSSSSEKGKGGRRGVRKEVSRHSKLRGKKSIRAERPKKKEVSVEIYILLRTTVDRRRRGERGEGGLNRGRKKRHDRCAGREREYKKLQEVIGHCKVF